MGIENVPSKSEFTAFLRKTVTDSVAAGYSAMPLSQSKLYMIRKMRERDVEVAEGVEITDAMITWFNRGEKWYWNGWNGRPTFFPGRKSSPGESGGNGRWRDGVLVLRYGGGGRRGGSRGGGGVFCTACDSYH